MKSNQVKSNGKVHTDESDADFEYRWHRNSVQACLGDRKQHCNGSSEQDTTEMTNHKPSFDKSSTN